MNQVTFRFREVQDCPDDCMSAQKHAKYSVAFGQTVGVHCRLFVYVNHFLSIFRKRSFTKLIDHFSDNIRTNSSPHPFSCLRILINDFSSYVDGIVCINKTLHHYNVLLEMGSFTNLVPMY